MEVRLGRRGFLKDGAIALAAAAALPPFLARAAGSAGERRRKLVVVFLRGAADALNVIIPHGDPSYAALRPTLAIPRPEVLDLDGRFGLHPALSAIAPFFGNGQLAVIVASGSPDPTRSHFEAQDYMESGTPGLPATRDGWLNRVVGGLPGPGSPWRAVSPGPNLPRILSGTAPTLALGGLAAAPRGPDAAALEAMYRGSGDARTRAEASAAFDAVRALRAAERSAGTRATYPRGALGEQLRRIASVLRADLGVVAAFADMGGFDHHVNEGAVEGQLADRLRELGAALSAFWTDLAEDAGDVVVVTLTEFGRTARENGNRGTDHGHGGFMLVLGGGVRGGRVYGRWPGLAPEELHDGRDLPVTTDFRLVLGELVLRHLGSSRVDQVFPGFDVAVAGGFLGLIG